jgi:hypothetical protein
MKAVMFTSLGVIAAMILLKEAIPGKDKRFILNPQLHQFHIVFGVILLVLVDVFGGMWLYNLLRSVAAKRKWSARRRTASQKVAVRGVIMNAILISYIVTNSLVLSDSKSFCETTAALKISQFVRWTGWNSMLLILVIDGHGVVLRETPTSQDGLVMDLPWYIHWPKLIIWVPLTGAVVWPTP